MAHLTRFTDFERIRRNVAGCPLATVPPSDDESACARCPYNVVAPGEPTIGCQVRLPNDIIDAALAGLKARAPVLAEELEALLASARDLTGEAGDPAPGRWMALAEAWYESIEEGPSASAEREVAMVIARFARAARERSEAVLLLE